MDVEVGDRGGRYTRLRKVLMTAPHYFDLQPTFACAYASKMCIPGTTAAIAAVRARHTSGEATTGWVG